MGIVMSSIRYLKNESNNYLNIWVIGNNHGDSQLLQSRFHQLHFNAESDLLISVGDNIDRCPDSQLR